MRTQQGGISVRASQNSRYVDSDHFSPYSSKPIWRSAKILRTSMGVSASLMSNIRREIDFILSRAGIIYHIESHQRERYQTQMLV